MSEHGIQFDPTELAFLPQNVDPLHPVPPLLLVIGAGLAPFLLILDRHWIRVHVQLEVGLLPRPKILVEMHMKELDQVLDRQERIAHDGVYQKGVIEHDAKFGALWCALYDHKILLFGGDWAIDTAGGDVGSAWVFRDVVMDFGTIEVRAYRHEGVNRQRGGEHYGRDHRAGRITAALVWEI